MTFLQIQHSQFMWTPLDFGSCCICIFQMTVFSRFYILLHVCVRAVRSLTCTVVGWTFTLNVRLCKSPCFCFLYSLNDLSKHVILFQNMDKELVTSGFVSWKLLQTPRAAPLDTSNISMMFTHLQGRSTPCSHVGSVSCYGLHFRKTKLDAIETALLLLSRHKG